MNRNVKIGLILIAIGDVSLLIAFLATASTLTGAGLVFLMVGIGVLSFLGGVLGYVMWAKLRKGNAPGPVDKPKQ